METARDVKTKNDVCYLLASLKDRMSFDFFVFSLEDEDIKQCSIFALGELGDPRATELLEDEIYFTLSNGEITINLNAVKALVKIHRSKALNVLLEIDKNYHPTSKLGRMQKNELNQIIQTLK